MRGRGRRRVSFPITYRRTAWGGLLPSRQSSKSRCRSILVSFAVAPLIGVDNYWGGVLVAAGVLTLTMVIAMFVRETPMAGKLPA